MDRLIGILTVLLQQEKCTAPELAKRFEVSRRTINRDVEDLCKAGIPLVTTQGYGGGIAIADGYTLDRSLFTEEELQTVLSGIRGLGSVMDTNQLSGLLDKLAGHPKSSATEDIVLIDLASHYQAPLTEKIGTIKQAIRRRHSISFQYYTAQGKQQRSVDPYHLVFRWSSWYIFGYCPDRTAFRLFKLNRLWDLQVSPSIYSVRGIPPEELDFGDYFTDTETIHLQALFEENQRHRLIDEYGIACYSTQEDGRLFFEWDFSSYDYLREWVFSFGDKVRILQPEQLRQDRIRQAEHILQMDLPEIEEEN